MMLGALRALKKIFLALLLLLSPPILAIVIASSFDLLDVVAVESPGPAPG
jgi:hypothetical protein